MLVPREPEPESAVYRHRLPYGSSRRRVALEQATLGGTVAVECWHSTTKIFAVGQPQGDFAQEFGCSPTVGPPLANVIRLPRSKLIGLAERLGPRQKTC